MRRDLVRKARIIDEYFEAEDYFPHIPFRPIGEKLIRAREYTRPDPLWVSSGAALVEKESGGKLIIGCDAGSIHCHRRVTKARVRQILAHPVSNGIGLTQITFKPLLWDAEKLGGAHLAINQMRVGFDLLNELFKRYPYLNAVEAYNTGTGATNDAANLYDLEFAALHEAWKARLA